MADRRPDLDLRGGHELEEDEGGRLKNNPKILTNQTQTILDHTTGSDRRDIQGICVGRIY
ncbi:hypothetical protein H4Q26_000278 [Puccinia striiformis f. sp. tritici PST-130]|nr:hypothetical protein H4Q26_000278 [Puccinia striiformis f. sp. tritici PST-130]